MVHPLLENFTTGEDKDIKRISSLEQRVADLENRLLRASTAALEKRVKELEYSLNESNEECIKLRQTIDNMNNNGDDCNNDNGKDDHFSIGIGDNNGQIDEESDIIYERILNLVETMKLDCTRSMNFKIPVHSGLPKFPTRQSSRSNLSKASTANIARPRTPSLIGGISRPSTPTGIQRPSTPSPISSSSPPSSPSSSSSSSSFIQSPSTPSGIQVLSSIQRPSSPFGIQIPSNQINNHIAPITTNINNNNIIGNYGGNIVTSPTKMPTPTIKKPTRPSTYPLIINNGSNNNYNNNNNNNNNKIPSRPSTPTGIHHPKTVTFSRPSTPGTISPPLSQTTFTSAKTAIPVHIPLMRNCRQSTM